MHKFVMDAHCDDVIVKQLREYQHVITTEPIGFEVVKLSIKRDALLEILQRIFGIYKGYTCKIGIDDDCITLHGKLICSDLVTFEANSIYGLSLAFKEAVNDIINIKL